MIKVKRDTITKARAAAWKEFSRFIRLRDCLFTTGNLEYGRCVTCGKVLEFSRLQAGHFIPGRNNSILFDVRCVHAQCVGCNVYGGGQQPSYYWYMVEKYGKETIDSLFRQANCSLKLTAPDLREMAARFRRWSKHIEQNGIVPAEDIEPYMVELRSRIGMR